MNQPYTDDLLEILATAPSDPDKTRLETLELRNPGMVDDAGQPYSIFLVNEKDPWRAALVPGGPMVDFVPCAFDLVPPSQDGTGQLPELALNIDNVSGLVGPVLKTMLASRQPTTATVREYIADDSTMPQNNPPLVLTVGSVTVSTLRVTAKATIPRITDLKFPALNYTNALCPALSA